MEATTILTGRTQAPPLPDIEDAMRPTKPRSYLSTCARLQHFVPTGGNVFRCPFAEGQVECCRTAGLPPPGHGPAKFASPAGFMAARYRLAHPTA
jgi:hypothetical protein